MLKLLALKNIPSSFVAPVRCISIGTFTAGGKGLHEPSAPAPGRNPLWSETSSEIFAELKDGDKVFVQGAAATPSILCSHLYQHVKEGGLKNINAFQLRPMGPLYYLNDDVRDSFRLSTSIASSYCREAINNGKADFIPISVSELPLLYRMKHVDIDFALVSVSPPDKHGFCTLGPSVGSARSAIQNAKRIVAQVNPMLPVSYGDSTIHMSKIDCLVHGPQPLIETIWGSASVPEQKIATFIAENLVEDGATLQLESSRLSQEITSQLRSHKNLGLHTECFTDGEVDLVNLGVIDNCFKTIRRGRIVASYVIGTKKVFDFINENPLVALYDIAWTNSPEVIARNPKVTAINRAFEMDLTGQSSSESLGDTIYTGVGGLIDFIRAASLCSDGKGKPVLTMTSLTTDGQSSIVPFLPRGTGVTATRAHVHYVVTEYGIAYLFGKNLRQRAYALIKIAHPDFRESLEKASFERLKCMPTP